MNIKTTLFLGLAFAVVALGYMGWHRIQSAPADKEQTASNQEGPGKPAADSENRFLFQPPFEDDTKIVRVAYHKRGKPKLVFERTEEDDTPRGNWVMVEPTPCQATSWTVNNLITAVKKLKYASKMALNADGGPTLEGAGLRPEPRASFELTSEDGDTVRVDVGDALIANNNTYVFLPDQTDFLYVAEASFDPILKRDLAQYREKKLFQFSSADAVELEVVQQSDSQPTTYRLIKQDGDWHFTAPFKARANNRNIQQVVSGVNRLRARNWLDEVPTPLADFGLDPPYLQVKVITEKEIEQAEPDEPAQEKEEGQDNENESSELEGPPEVTLERQEFVVQISQQKPIDDNTQIYIKRAGEEQVGTVSASELEKFTPDVSKWRDMAVITPEVINADSLTIKLPQGTIRLKKDADKWVLAESEGLAELTVVIDVLVQLDTLKAVNFLDDPPAASELGLDSPEVTISTTLPHSAKRITLAIGNYTEAVEKRLRYVQRTGSTAVAKVLNKDLEIFFQDPSQYRNREILAVEPARISEIHITRQLPESGRQQSVSLSRDENRVWQMTKPIAAEVDLKPANDLVDQLAKLRGLGVVDELNPANLGLDQPQIQVAIVLEPIPTIQAEFKEDETEEVDQDAQDTQPAEKESSSLESTAPEPTTILIHFAKKDRKYYARRLDRPTSFEVSKKIYDGLMAEFLTGNIFDLELSQVVAFSSTSEGRTVGFRKHRDRWQYSADPDIPVDVKKIEKHINQMAAIRTNRYVEYLAPNLAEFGLDLPAHRFTFEGEDGTSMELLISDSTSKTGGDRRLFATVVGSGPVFLIRPSMVKLGTIKLEKFEPNP